MYMLKENIKHIKQQLSYA